MINQYFDHTLLKPNINENDVINLCEEANQYRFMSVCVNPNYVKLCSERLKDSPVKVCSVVGFPLGANKISTKIFEAKEAIIDGATELDYVINISAIKDKEFKYIEEEMKAFIDLKNEFKIIVIKVILETCYLTSDEIIKVCSIARKLKIDYVKTSTGFGSSGAKVEDIELMKDVTEGDVKIKASGGIRTKNDFTVFKEAGVDRIGASSTVSIMNDSNDGSEDGY